MERKNQQHKRINQSFLGVVERPALAWLVKKMPSWVTPDKLTLTGLFGTILTGISYYLTNFNPVFLWLASLGLLINWFGDSLDGTIARYRKIERPKYGFFVDHILDGVGETLIIFGIALSPYVDFGVAMVALVGYLLLGNMVYITTFVRGVFRISYIGLGPTEMRAILIITNAFVFFIGSPKVKTPLGTYTVYDYVLIGLSVLMFGVFLITSMTTARELAQEEKQARKQKSENAGKKEQTTISSDGAEQELSSIVK